MSVGSLLSDGLFAFTSDEVQSARHSNSLWRLISKGNDFIVEVRRPESDLGTAGRYERKPQLGSLAEGGKSYRMLTVMRPSTRAGSYGLGQICIN